MCTDQHLHLHLHHKQWCRCLVIWFCGITNSVSVSSVTIVVAHPPSCCIYLRGGGNGGDRFWLYNNTWKHPVCEPRPLQWGVKQYVKRKKEIRVYVGIHGFSFNAHQPSIVQCWRSINLATVCHPCIQKQSLAQMWLNKSCQWSIITHSEISVVLKTCFLQKILLTKIAVFVEMTLVSSCTVCLCTKYTSRT